MDWDRARRTQRATKSQPNLRKPATRSGSPSLPGIDHNDPNLIWITVGADCPWNTTPGTRQVWRNGSPLKDEP